MISIPDWEDKMGGLLNCEGHCISNWKLNQFTRDPHPPPTFILIFKFTQHRNYCQVWASKRWEGQHPGQTTNSWPQWITRHQKTAINLCQYFVFLQHFLFPLFLPGCRSVRVIPKIDLLKINHDHYLTSLATMSFLRCAQRYEGSSTNPSHDAPREKCLCGRWRY